jgi:hypothetical protein
MPHQQQVKETYWCPGGWPWEWFDTCTRVVTKWCYDFSWVEENGYGFFSYDKGCEQGTLYTWYAFSFNIFGSTTFGPMEMCFDSQLSSGGRCPPAAAETARREITDAHAQKMQRRVRFRQHHETVAAPTEDG